MVIKQSIMKWLIFGSKGWIGHQFLNILSKQNEEIMEAESRADQYLDVLNEIKSKKPDRVVSLIGRTYGPGFNTIDYLEQNGKVYENVRDNLVGPLNISLICQMQEIHFTYLGTGCIFEYEQEDWKRIQNDECPMNSVDEDSKPNFFGSSYSIVKGFTDDLFHHSSNTLNCRIRMPIVGDGSGRCFISKITQYEKICSIPNSMSVLPELLPMMIDLAKKKITGTINLTNPGVISHNEILGMYKEIVDPSFQWKNFSIQEQNEILLSRRSNNFMDTKRLESFFPHVSPIKEAVRNVLKQMKKIN